MEACPARLALKQRDGPRVLFAPKHQLGFFLRSAVCFQTGIATLNHLTAITLRLTSRTTIA